MFTRKFARILGRLVLTIALVGGAIFLFDLWYDFLPSNLQTRLPFHENDPVIVGIKIETCGLFTNCPETDEFWQKQPKDLYLRSSWTSHAYIYTHFLNQDDLGWEQDVIVAIAHSPNSKDLPVEVLGEVEVSSIEAASPKEKALRLRWKHVGHGLWVKYGKHQPGKAVTAVKVLYSQSALYSVKGWTIPSNYIGLGKAEPRLAYRVGPEAPIPSIPTLRFNKDGRFKVAQLADIHMSTGWGKCDHPVPPPGEGEECLADMRTAHFVDDVLHEEKPDLVVFSGDQIVDSVADPETAIMKALDAVLDKQLPFAAIFGNHDVTPSMSKQEMMRIMEKLPLFMGGGGPDDIPGVGNYVITVAPPAGTLHSVVEAATGAKDDYPALTLYFLDSHAKSNEPQRSIYDWIRAPQLDFIKSKHEEIKNSLQGYSKIPMAMSFVHIPLPEYRDDLMDEGGKAGVIRIGTKRENVISPEFDDGALQTFRNIGVSVVSVGHDHANDYCQLEQWETNDEDPQNDNIWLCYGGGTGEGGYGGYTDNEGNDYERRVRIYEYDMNGPYIETWHRVQNHDEIVNKAKLVTSGKASYVAKDEA